MAEDFIKAARTEMRNQLAQAKASTELEKEGLALAEKMMEQAFKKDATISEDMGKEVLGYISKAASVKKRGANPKPDPTPALSGPSAGKGNTQTAVEKAALDILTGKTSTSSTVVKKVLTPGNIEGIRQANKDGFKLTEEEINEKFDDAAKQLEIDANDPAVKEKFRQLGIPEETFTGLTDNLQSGIKELSAKNIGGEVVAAQKKMSEKQMTQLSNPFGSFKSKINVPSLNVKAGDALAPGSDLISQMKAKTGLTEENLSIKNPFGSMGVDFGNIQGTIASLAKGGPAFKDLNSNLPSVSGAPNIAATGLTADKIPDIINKGGFTNLQETVSKTEAIPDNIEPSTPVEEIGVPNNRPVTTLVYTTAHTSEEIELELGATKREIDLIITGWTQNAIDEREKSAKAFNESVQELRKEQFGDGTEQENSSGTHYIILRDGTIQRILNTEVSAVARPKGQDNHINVVNDAYKSAIIIRFDAGYTCTAAEKNFKFLSVKSISEEQFESYKLFMEACTRALPGTGHISFSDFISFTAKIAGLSNSSASRNSFIFGPGFSAAKYALNFNTGVENPLEGTGPNSVNILNFLTGGGG